MAKRFTFRFETMLKIRRQREDEHKRIVADRIRQIAETQEQIASLGRQIGEEMDAMRSRQSPGTIDIQQAIRHRHWLGHLHRNALEAESRLRYLEAKLVQERAALAEAARQRRILEKLKERQHDRFVREQDRRETLQLDELATVRYVYEGAERRSVSGRG